MVKPFTKNMKYHLIIVMCTSFTFSCKTLYADELKWIPGEEYDIARPKNEPSPWQNNKIYRRVEYRLLYLLEADAVLTKVKRAENVEGKRLELSRVLDNLDEVLEVCYEESVSYFKDKPNPRLLMMMLYHYEVDGNSAMERWGPTIKALRAIDPEIAKQATISAEAAKSKKK